MEEMESEEYEEVDSALKIVRWKWPQTALRENVISIKLIESTHWQEGELGGLSEEEK